VIVLNDINPDPWGNIVVTVNGADVVVIPKPFATDATGNATSWYWNFGDGTNSTDQNPQHTYAAVGT
jgi:PKD repeat protein